MSYGRGDQTVDSKVYVGDLGNDCSKQELEEKFQRFGNLRNVWVARRPAGFAFVEFDDPRDAEDAVRSLDGVRINGRRARVEMSNGRSRGGRKFGGGDRGPPRGGPRYDDYRPPRRSPSPRRPRSRSRSYSPVQRRRSRSASRDRYARSRSR